MPVTIRTGFDYPASADAVWADLVSYDALAESMAGGMTYVGLPTGQVRAGDDFEVALKMWGWFPVGRWRMHVVERDDAGRALRSEEGGGVVTLYHHRLTVEPLTEHTCRYEDEIVLDAGLFTGFYRRSVEAMYRDRHLARAKRLGAG